MILLEGEKKFYLIPPEVEEQMKHWFGVGPVFTSQERVAEGMALGL